MFSKKATWAKPLNTLNSKVYSNILETEIIFQILKFMLVETDFAYDKWKIVRNLFELFLGIKPIGET